ncbi:Zn-ribbon domain-containing OB-fold protein [Amycolatopsis pigmentata]|uniref:Zn-ribbon domain-containing OB-fold protein n=1 Tax=Amycolatopsis pigmentata TaxID=450801 RepID=A0ABW5FND3_9PSEU
MSAPLPTPAPIVTVETKPFWDATASGRMLLPRCTECATVIWYPRSWCPACLSREIEWIEASGRGTVYSHSTVRRGAMPPFNEALPYVLAYVELEEGPRMLTNIVTDDPDSVSVGQAVELVFQSYGEGALPRFRPVEGD